MLDGRRVLLTSDLAGLLRAEAQLMQYPRDVAGMVRDAEPPTNRLGHPLANPQFRLEAGGGRAGDDQVDQYVALALRKHVDAPRVRLGRDGVRASFTPRALPMLYAADMHAETVGHRAKRLPSLEALHSATTASF